MKQALSRERAMGLPDVYEAVLRHFVEERCRPAEMCPEYRNPHPEYRHLTRLALWDLQRSGEAARLGGGMWKLA